MAHVPLFLWILAGVVPTVFALLMLVESKVVQPAIRDERRQNRPPPQAAE